MVTYTSLPSKAVDSSPSYFYSESSGGAVRKTAASAYVTLTGSQTLTNKTLTSPAVTTPVINGTTVSGVPVQVANMRGHLFGMTLSNNGTDATNDIDIAAGSCVDSTGTDVMTLSSSITKQLDNAWVVGNNLGGLDTGTIANTTYHVYVIKRVDTGVVDVIFSTSASAPTLPTNYTLYRRIGSIIRAGGTILAFSQNGDEFLLAVPVFDVDISTLGTSAALQTLSVPTGITVNALMRVRGTNAATWAVIVSSPSVTDTAPGGSTNPLHDVGGTAGNADRATISVRTNTSSQVRARSTAASTTLQIATYGWVDTRGRS